METNAVFLRGKKVILRPYDESRDLELFTIWMNDQEVKQFVGTRPFPLPLSVERKQMEEMMQRPDNLFCVIETHDGVVIGTMGLHRINWVNRTAVTGTMIGNRAYWGKGYGTDAKMTLLRYAFTELNLRTLQSAVIAFNVRSHRALLKQGYREVGRMPQWHFRKGRYHDEVLFVLTKKDFMRVWLAYDKK